MTRKGPEALPRLSEGEATFALHCRVEGLEPVREYRFHPERKWRFDFAFPEQKLAVEVEGIGRHQRMGGYQKDLAKYNSAALLGWNVLRYTTQMVKTGVAINDVLEAMGKEPQL